MRSGKCTTCSNNMHRLGILRNYMTRLVPFFGSLQSDIILAVFGQLICTVSRRPKAQDFRC
jgi:hypothetical protein